MSDPRTTTRDGSPRDRATMRLCKHEYDISSSLCPRCSIEAKEAAIERRIAEANRTGQAMGARIGQDLSEERRIAAGRCMRERNEAVRERDKWKARALEAEKASRIAREVEPRDTEPPRDAVVDPGIYRADCRTGATPCLQGCHHGECYRARTMEPRLQSAVERSQMILEAKDNWKERAEKAERALVDESEALARVVQERDKARACQAVTKDELDAMRATSAPGLPSFGAQCVAEVGAWPDWKKNAAAPPVETPEPEPNKPPNPYGLSDGRADIWHSGMMRAWAAWLDHIEGTPAPEPALPKGARLLEGQVHWKRGDRTWMFYAEDDGVTCCVDGVRPVHKSGEWMACANAALANRGTPGSTEPTGQHEFARHGGRRGRTEP